MLILLKGDEALFINVTKLYNHLQKGRLNNTLIWYSENCRKSHAIGTVFINSHNIALLPSKQSTDKTIFEVIKETSNIKCQTPSLRV